MRHLYKKDEIIGRLGAWVVCDDLEYFGYLILGLILFRDD